MPRPTDLHHPPAINPFLAFKEAANYTGAPTETLTMPREKMDAVLELVNTNELLEELKEEYTAEQYLQLTQEMNRVIPDIDYTKVVQSDKGHGHREVMERFHKERDSKAARQQRKEAAEKLDKKIQQLQAAKKASAKAPSPVNVTIPVGKSVTLEEFTTIMRQAENQFDIQNGMDQSAVKSHVLSSESIEALYQVMTRVYGIDNVSGDTALNQFQFMRFSDGTMNIITNHALYNGMLLRPDDRFQGMKEQGEQQRSFAVTLFAKGPEGMEHAKAQTQEISAPRSTAPTPFNTQLTHPTDRK